MIDGNFNYSSKNCGCCTGKAMQHPGNENGQALRCWPVFRFTGCLPPPEKWVSLVTFTHELGGRRPMIPFGTEPAHKTSHPAKPSPGMRCAGIAATAERTHISPGEGRSNASTQRSCSREGPAAGRPLFFVLRYSPGVTRRTTERNESLFKVNKLFIVPLNTETAMTDIGRGGV